MNQLQLASLAFGAAVPTACENDRTTRTADCATFRTSLTIQDRMSQAADTFQ